jgi:inner membrane protein COX18
LSLNLITRLPTTLYSRRIAILRQKLHPLTLAWAGRVGVEMNAAAAERGSQRMTGLAARQRIKEFQVENMAAVGKRQKRWGVQRWKDWVPSVVVFPVWIVGIEALRRMCGGPRGLVGRIVFGSGTGEEGRVESVAAAVVDNCQGVVAEGVASGSDVGALEVVTGQAEVQEGLARYLADPSMATGGCLWFPDLTAADPLHILPLALSAILVLNVMPKTMPQLRILLGLDSTPEGAIGSSKWRLRLQRSLLMVAMAVGPLTMDLPAALHLYWISSAALTATQTAIISWLMPMPKNVPPAKRGESVFVMPTREKP